MKLLRKWSRILHRDIGFFFVGTSIIYGLSGLALNHIKDWNPSYFVELKKISTKIDLSPNENSQQNIFVFLKEVGLENEYKQHYYPQKSSLKIFLQGGSSVIVNTETGIGQAEFLRKRPIFYETNFLHYNPNVWWAWFSDAYAVSLILFSVSSLFMVKGKKGALGRGGFYIAAGIIIPVLFLIFL